MRRIKLIWRKGNLNVDLKWLNILLLMHIKIIIIYYVNPPGLYIRMYESQLNI